VSVCVCDIYEESCAVNIPPLFPCQIFKSSKRICWVRVDERHINRMSTETVTFLLEMPVYVTVTKETFKTKYGGTDELWTELVGSANEKSEFVGVRQPRIDAEAEAPTSAVTKAMNHFIADTLVYLEDQKYEREGTDEE